MDPTPNTKIYHVYESIAAISAHIGASTNRANAYDAAADSMGGFTGFYTAAIDVANTLEEYISARRLEWGGHFDWILTVEKLSEELLLFMIRECRLPNATERILLVKDSLLPKPGVLDWMPPS